MLRGILIIVVGGALLWLAATRLFPRLGSIWSPTELEPPASFVTRPSSPETERPMLTAEDPGDSGKAELESASDGGPKHLAVPPDPEVVLGRDEPAEPPAAAFRASLESMDRTEIGRLLAHEDRYQVLESYLNEGEGRKLPESIRKLVSAFWLALSGQHAEAEALASGVAEAEGVTSEQLAVLAAAIAGDRPRARDASVSGRDPLARGMQLALLDRLASAWLRQARHQEAAEALSDLLLAALGAPWQPDHDDLLRWMGDLAAAQQHHRWNPAGSWPSQSYEVKQGESLVGIRKFLVTEQPGLLLCVGLIERANGLGPRPIQPGQTLRIPTDVPSALVDVDARVLLYLHGDEVVGAWEIGTGKPGQETPTGSFVVGLKQEDPSYMPIGGPDLPFGHPENPLGTRWIAWYRGTERTGYGIHGTNDPAGVGATVSNGCVRMRNEDVEVLFDVLPQGAAVIVQP